MDLAIDLAAGEKEALRQSLAGLSDLNAVEASMVLRNLSTSKGINLNQEGKLRGRAGVVVDPRGFNELADALLRLGIAERITDAEVVEEDPPPALPP